MNIGNLRDMSSHCHWADEILFEDSEGNIRPIWTAIRVRSGGDFKIILKETVVNDFEFKVDKNPPKELLDRLDEYLESKDRLLYGSDIL